ncbi:MAG TPA: hypothetical protein VMV48_08145 [Gallionellaceae bacterium]|nr:hypothetical protein [Gallionellaceae bacterium]
MNSIPRFTINRTVVLLGPRQPFLDWLNNVDPDDEALTVEDLREDNEVFLIPQYNDNSDSEKWVEKRWSFLFEHMLMGWVDDEALWPQDRTLEMFREWFEIEIHTMAWDLSDEPLIVEDWQDEDDDENKGIEKIHLH